MSDTKAPIERGDSVHRLSDGRAGVVLSVFNADLESDFRFCNVKFANGSSSTEIATNLSVIPETE